MFQDTSPVPHLLSQNLWPSVAGILAIAGFIGGWFVRRRREPLELDKLRAETKNIHITAENAQVSVGLETLRELQSLTREAQERREEWNQYEDELRTQIRFWRNKAEELDGQLIDSRATNDLLQSEVASYELQIRTMKATLTFSEQNYDNTQDVKIPKPKP